MLQVNYQVLRDRRHYATVKNVEWWKCI